MMTQGFFNAILPETEKLSQLRSKTDRQILDFIHSKLDLALDLAAQADAQKLLLALNESQRRGLDRKLNEVTEALGRICQNPELLRPLFLIARSQSRA
jgi:hypothetical protein